MTLSHAIAGVDVAIPTVDLAGAAISLPGRLTVPDSAIGIVLFAHGSGSGRNSPRNVFVAAVLHEAWLGTLLFDLLTPQEATDRANVFDVRLLADRLLAAVRFVADHEPTRQLPLGLFGASTGAAAALVAASEEPRVVVVVSRGGRPDLAAAALGRVRVPTLLVVGGDDTDVLLLNRRAFAALRCEKRLTIVPGATHLFEEPGTLDEVARLAAEWCVRQMRPRTTGG